MARNNQQFTTIRTEGALLPPDILQRIVSQKVDGMRPADYHLPEGFKTTEAITQSWDMLKKHWKAFQEAKEQLADTDTGTSMTNERWLLPLFRELDYGRLTTETAPVIEDRTYPIERFYNKTPIHLIGWNLTLDRRTKGARGAATSSPHSMVQEYLNRSEAHLWAFVSNGRQLRLLRDNVALSRQAFVEFDLEAMMEGEVYSDFALLWMLCHQSRVEAEKTADCWLEKWSKLAREEGTRVLNNLRTGVADAIEALGRGFLAHPRNDELRRKLQESGSLSKDDFYRQLLRIVYRLLFLFVAEDRELLHPTDVDEKARELYRKYYSTIRLRDMSLKLRGSKHGDLWHSLTLVFAALGKNEGCPQLGLVGLGSFLWNTKSVVDLSGPYEVIGDTIPVQIANDDLLTAIRSLAYVEQDRVLRSVDYRNLGSEELGSVYESLLELNPDMQVEARHFELRTAAGNERKTSGSYYTPDSLVQCLLDSALDPVVEDRLKGKKGEAAEDAILSMTVCDPACGSGHFLIAAAHRLARHLARVRTGDAEPSPEDHQHALRDVIGRCIYGVDINPMAVELCKVSLWIEAIEPGKPLSFLEHHVRCGNSLLGATPKLLADGIPDDAFKPIEGDVKVVASEMKKQNKSERKDYKSGQRHLFEPYLKLGDLPSEFVRLSSDSDESVAEVADKEQRYAKLISQPDYQNARLLADTWCAVFVWYKDNSDLGKLCPTERDFRQIEGNPHSVLPHVKAEVRRLSDQYQFFHWHLAFPEVFRQPEDGSVQNEQMGWSGGFSVVLGNPPWDQSEFSETEWFSSRVPEIALAANTTVRRKLVAALADSDEDTYRQFLDASRAMAGLTHLIRSSGRYPLCGSGRVNLYAIFAECALASISGIGSFGLVLPTGIVTDNSTKTFFQYLVERHLIRSAYDFHNREGHFPTVKPHQHFCLLTLSGEDFTPSNVMQFAFGCANVSELRVMDRIYPLTAAAIELINPNTKTCPIFPCIEDAAITQYWYESFPVLVREDASAVNEWNLSFKQGLFNVSSNADLFRTASRLVDEGYSQDGQAFFNGHKRYLPLFDAKMAQQYSHRAASLTGSGHQFRKVAKKTSSVTDLADPNFHPSCLYWVAEPDVEAQLVDWPQKWLVGFKDVTGTTSERLAAFSVIPRVGVGHPFPIIFTNQEPLLVASLMALLNCLVTEFILRKKIQGLHVTFYYLKQLPVPEPAVFTTQCPFDCRLRFALWVTQRVLELTYTAWDLKAFAVDCGYDGPPFRWDEERRFLLRCELDAAYFNLYLGSPNEWGTNSPGLREMFPTPRNAVDYIMETFPIIKRKDIKRTEILGDTGEVVQEGTYFTKDTILSIYDEMQRAIESGQPYQFRLDPQPGPPTDADGNFIPMAQWDPNNWPSHIHPPREEANS